MLSEEEFQLISDFARNQAKKIRKEILSGNAQYKPYALDGHTGCDYCPYHAVCGFEEKIDGYDYRKLDKLDNEKALEKMRKEVETWE